MIEELYLTYVFLFHEAIVLIDLESNNVNDKPFLELILIIFLNSNVR